MPKFGTKNTLPRYFFGKTILIFEINTIRDFPQWITRQESFLLNGMSYVFSQYAYHLSFTQNTLFKQFF